MPPQLVSYVDRKDTEQIREYLTSHNLGNNKYRVKVGEGVSQCLGIVSKRSQAPDLSRQSWLHPRLHNMLIEFGKKYVLPHITYTSIQVNCNYPCKAHKDISNVGDSYIVAFGDYSGGQLCIEDANYTIDKRGLLFNGSELRHWTREWTGQRISLVYHTLKPKFPMLRQLSDYMAVEHEGIWKIRYLEGDGEHYLWKGHGLSHPLLGRKKVLPS
jgi:hypothetical protein